MKIKQDVNFQGIVSQRVDGMYEAELFKIGGVYALGDNETEAAFNLLNRIKRYGFDVESEIKFYLPKEDDPIKQTSYLFDVTIKNFFNAMISFVFRAETKFRFMDTKTRERNFTTKN